VAAEKIDVELRPTRVLAPLLIGAHLAVALTLSIAFGFGWLLLPCWLLLAASAAGVVARTSAANSASRLELSAERDCRWQLAERKIEGMLRADTTALSWFIVLRCDLPAQAGVLSLILFPDSLAGDDWRRLSVFLRWGVQFAGASESSAEHS
jgi:hypothetical protein